MLDASIRTVWWFLMFRSTIFEGIHWNDLECGSLQRQELLSVRASSPLGLVKWLWFGSTGEVKWVCLNHKKPWEFEVPLFLTTPKYSHPRNMKHLNTLNGRKYVRATCKTIVSGGCSMFRERDYSHGRNHCWPGNSWTSYILNGKVAWYMWQGNKLERHGNIRQEY